MISETDKDRFESDRAAGIKIAEKYYSGGPAFNEAFAEGFAIALTAIESTRKELEKNAGTGD